MNRRRRFMKWMTEDAVRWEYIPSDEDAPGEEPKGFLAGMSRWDVLKQVIGEEAALLLGIFLGGLLFQGLIWILGR